MKIDIKQVEQFTLRRIASDFLGKSPRNEKIESEYVPSRVRLIKHEEANTEYGIGSRGSVRVGTGF